MPYQQRYGFVTMKSEDLVRTIAHELGHGAFGLEHTAEPQYDIKDMYGNLMGVNNSANLCKFQWDIIHTKAGATDFDSVDKIMDVGIRKDTALLCFYEIEGNKFYNGDTIYMPYLNKKFEIKGYVNDTALFDSKAVWSGFESKKETSTYYYDPVANSDRDYHLISTIYEKTISENTDSSGQNSKVVKIIKDTLSSYVYTKCAYYEIEGHKYYNLDTIYIPRSTKRFAVKGYVKDVLFTAESKWSGFGSKKDSTYYYTPAAVSADKKGNVIYTVYPFNGKTDTLQCQVVVLDAKVLSTTEFDDPNIIAKYNHHGTFNNKNIPWKSIKGGGNFNISTTPTELADKLTFYKHNNIRFSESHYFKMISSSSNYMLDTLYLKAEKIKDSIQQVGVFSYTDTRERTVGIIYVDEYDSASNFSYSAGNIPCSTFDLEMALNEIYYPAGIDFIQVDIMPERLRIHYDLDKDSCVTNGSKERERLLDEVWKYVQKKGDPYTYYFIMVKYTKGAKKRVFGFGSGLDKERGADDKYCKTIFVALGGITTPQRAIQYANTCAHELGHSAFNLYHPYSSLEKGTRNYLEADDKENFMDLYDGMRSRQYQWKQIREKDKFNEQ